MENSTVTRRSILMALSGLAVLPVLGPCEFLSSRPRKYVVGACGHVDRQKRFLRGIFMGEKFHVEHSDDGLTWTDIPEANIKEGWSIPVFWWGRDVAQF